MSEHNCDGWDSCPNPAPRSPTLTDFLLARIAEDEEYARWLGGERWHLRENGHEMIDSADGREVISYGGETNVSDSEHIARHDPARVLAECEAKRTLVADLISEKHEVVDGDCWYTCAAATEGRDGGETCDDARSGGHCDCGRDARVNRRLSILASIYADHPDYDESWRP